MKTCPVCGNDIEITVRQCVYCGETIENDLSTGNKSGVLYKAINLERGRPIAEMALKRMQLELEQARQGGVKVVSLIHGYGSSGKGGKIRVECRKSLDYMLQNGLLRKVIPGEHFWKSSGQGKSLTRQYPELKAHCRTDFNNPGITIVEF